jgi:ectoine hydroxylase-related dioxygenase (phytanoyl-CoA dioxygenase family)
MLSEEETARFWRDGYVVVEDVLAAHEVQALLAASETPDIQRELAERQQAQHLTHLLELTTKHPLFKSLARDERLTHRVAALLGGDLQLQHSKLACKPSAKGAGQFPWHQDFARFPHTSYDLVALSVMLDDATPENGGMYALRGSHELGLRNHQLDGWMVGPCYETELWENAPERIVPLMARAGGVIIHHCLLLHASPPTYSGKPRRMIGFEYRAGHALQLANNIWSDTGFQVLGEPSRRVKCEVMDLQLPKDPLWQRFCGDAHGNVYNQIGASARTWNAGSAELKD